jgi:hypothetical protein
MVNETSENDLGTRQNPIPYDPMHPVRLSQIDEHGVAWSPDTGKFHQSPNFLGSARIRGWNNEIFDEAQETRIREIVAEMIGEYLKNA